MACDTMFDCSDTDSDFSGFESDDLPIADLISENETSDSDNCDDRQMNWSVNDRTPRAKLAFDGPEPGPTTDLGPDCNEWDFVELFFPVFLIEMIVGQTNLFARQKQLTKPDPFWRPVVFHELKAWIGIRVYMSILQLPQTHMYWSTDNLFGYLSVRRIMKRDRFMKIQQYLHLNDRSQMKPRNHVDHDKLFLVRPVLDTVRNLCIQNYNPHQNVSVDEAMVKFRGRLSFRQYLPQKPTKYGIKVWMRADPTNGYVNDLQVYTGRVNNRTETGLAHRVVTDLVREINGNNHIVNVDNYFTSPQLFEELLNNGTYARGTVRMNRKGFPQAQLKPQDVTNQGDFKFAKKGDLLACVWMDKKPIYTLSTAEDPAVIDSSVIRKCKSGELKEVPAPSVIPAYNMSMNGVDHADQLRTAYSTFRISRRWWLYLFWYLFDTAVTNGFILMKESIHHQRQTKTNKPKPMTLLEFRSDLAKQLIGDYKDNECATLATVNVGHFPTNSVKRGRCRQCSKNKRRHECMSKCLECDVHICIPCFKDWHMDLVKM